MATTYNRSLSANFGGNIKPSRLKQEIIDDVTITIQLNSIDVNGDAVDITFASALSAPEIAQLDVLIAAHDGVSEEPQIELITTGALDSVTTIAFAPTTSRTITFPDATTEVVGTDTGQTMTNKTLTTPQIQTALLDINGNNMINFTPAVNAVNAITITNAAAGTQPTLTATGTDANIAIELVPKGTGTVTIAGDINTTGNLVVEGTTTTTDTANVLIKDSHIQLNKDYVTTSAKTGGLVITYFPTATVDTVNGDFTAGVASTSNPTVITTGSATFSAGDFIQFDSTNSENSNDGIYEVLSHVGTTLTIRGIGTTTTVEDFSQNQFVADTSIEGNIRKITISAIQVGTDGIWEVGNGSVSGIAYDDLISAAASQTLTNKTLTAPVISSISNTGTLTLPTSTDTLVGRATTDTLTNKTIDADNNTISNLAHGAEVDNPSSGVHGVTGNVVGTTDTQTLTNKTITMAGDLTMAGNDIVIPDNTADAFMIAEGANPYITFNTTDNSEGISIDKTTSISRYNPSYSTQTISTSYTVLKDDSNAILFTASVGNNSVILPDATTLPNGWVIKIINSDSSTTHINIQDNGANTIYAANIEAVVDIVLLDNSSANGNWEKSTAHDHNVIVVAKDTGDYGSIKDAIDSITDNSSSNQYVIKVGPGVYTENAITMKEYVVVKGAGREVTTIVAASATQTCITGVRNSHISGIKIMDASGIGGKGVSMSDAASSAINSTFRCMDVIIENCETCIHVLGAISLANRCSLTASNSLIKAPFTDAVVTNGDVGIAICSFITSRIDCDASITNAIKVEGLGANLLGSVIHINGANAGNGVLLRTGGSISIGSSKIQNTSIAVYVENSGSNSSVELSGVIAQSNITDLFIDQTTATGAITGIFERAKSIINSDSVVIQTHDRTVNGTTISGDLYIGETISTTSNVTDLITGAPMGLKNGGALSKGTGDLEIDITAGFGYAMVSSYDANNSGHHIRRVEWVAQSIFVPAGVVSYIYFTVNGTVQFSPSSVNPTFNIVLGRVKATGNTALFEITPITTTANIGNVLNGKYFTIDAPGASYYVWFNSDNSGTDPEIVGRTGVEVDISVNDSANTVAIAVAAELNSLSDFSVPVPGGATFTVTNANAGNVTDATAGDSGFTIGSITQGDGEIEFIEPSRIKAHHYGNFDNRYNIEVFGAQYVSGSTVTSNASRELAITGGVFYYSGTRYVPSGLASPATFYQYNHSSGSFVFSSQTVVNNTQYDNGTNLTALTASNYVKHSLYIVGDGGNERYMLVIGQEQFATLLDAQEGAMATPPSYFSEGVVAIASLIIQEGVTTVVEIRDERPRVGSVGSATAGVSAHGDLTGLTADDHTQYLLVSGARAMTGSLNMGTNNITNVGTVDGIDITAHAARHGANSLDDPLPTAAPIVSIGSGTSNSVGSANTFARSDHQHAIDSTIITTTGTQTMTNKTLTSPVLTTPQINDINSDHQYIFAVPDLAADRTVNLPTLTGNDTFVFEAHSQTLTNKTLTAPVISSISNTGTLTLPTSTDTLVGRATTDTLTNKTLTAPVISSIVNTGTLTLPTSTDTLVGRNTVDTLTNKTFTSAILTTPQINDTSSDNQYIFAVSELAANRTITLPLLASNDEFTFNSHTQTLTNKTLTAPVISSISNTGTLTLPTSTDTLVGRATADTLTNKTLTLPVISSISNTGTLTLPTSTDTLVGRATTDTLTNKTIVASNNTISGLLHGTHVDDPSSGVHGVTGDIVGTTDVQTLTNKTLTAPVISSISNTGTLTLPTSTDTLVGRATTDTLTNKTLTIPRIGTGILDTNGNEFITLTATTNAVNEFTYTNAATGNSPSITMSGGDTNIGLNLVMKGAGVLGITGDATLSGNLSGVDYIGMDVAAGGPAHSEGRVFYDNGEHALAVYNDEADVTHQLGQEGYIRVRNESGVTITNGSVVYVAGSDGVEFRPLVELARSDSQNTSTVIGVATHDIENNSFGYVTYWGVVNDVDTSSFAVGDVLYLDNSTPGGLRNTPPPTTTYTILIGFVIRSAVAGKILTTITPNVALPTGDALELTVSAIKASVGTISPGQVAYVTGYNITEGVVEVELADASSSATMPAIGIVRETITDIAVGVIVASGALSLTDTSSFSIGDPIFVSETTGAITNVKPTGTALIQKVGVVTRVNAVDGVIQIVGAGRTNDLPNLPQNNVWSGNASGVPVATQDLVLNTVSLGTLTNNTSIIFDKPTNDLTLVSSDQTVGAPTLTIPDLLGVSGDIVVSNLAQTLTNKTLTLPVISNVVNTGTISFPTSTDTLVGRATTDTLTNKTLTLPVISSISNTGTLTLPTSTDTLVGQATTDTLTNKTLTDTSNNVAAKSLHNATGLVDVSASTAPSIGQVLTATSGSAATWQTPNSSWKNPCRLATTQDLGSVGTGYVYANTGGAKARGQITWTTGPVLIDGVGLNDNDRILVKDNSVGASNGIWVRTSQNVWDRAEDFDDDHEVVSLATMWVEEGILNAELAYYLTTNNPITIGGATGTSMAFTSLQLNTDTIVCQARRSTIYTLTNGYVDVTLDVTDLENDAGVIAHDPVTLSERIVIGETGLYKIEYNAFATAPTSSNNIVNTRLLLNNTTEIAGSLATTESNGSNSVTYDAPHVRNIVANLTSGDYFTFQARSNNGGTAVGNLLTNTTIVVTRLRGTRGANGINGADGAPGDIIWTGTWDSGTTYTANQAVTFGGSSYVCILGHTNQVPPNATFWDLIASKGDQGPSGDITWFGDWDSGTAYGLNNAVTYLGTSYVCNTAHTNQVPPNASFWDILASKGDTGSTGATGPAGAAGDIVWRGAWNSGTTYVINDTVESNGSSYTCILGNLNQVPPNATFWDLVASKGDTGPQGPDGVIANTFVSAGNNATPVTTTSTAAFGAMVDVIGSMSAIPAAGTYLVQFSASAGISTKAANARFEMYFNGAALTYTQRSLYVAANNDRGSVNSHAQITSTGVETIEVRFSTSSGTVSVYGRSLTLIKVA